MEENRRRNTKYFVGRTTKSPFLASMLLTFKTSNFIFRLAGDNIVDDAQGNLTLLEISQSETASLYHVILIYSFSHSINNRASVSYYIVAGSIKQFHAKNIQDSRCRSGMDVAMGFFG
jgi:hypothetical protein